MSSIFGRLVVDTPTNKSGGSLAKGDVVVIDTGNDHAVTTTTSGATTTPVGVVIEENGIANNASGRVQFAGYVPLINVPASVTRGHYMQTHTVVKQATGNASRQAGSFGQFLTGGTTPTGYLFGIVDGSTGAGGIAATIFDAKGDLIVASAADTAARQAAGADSTVLVYDAAQTNGVKGVHPFGQAYFNYPRVFAGDVIDGSSTAPFVDVAAFDTKEVLNSRILHLQTLGASKTHNVRVTLGTTKAAAFDVRVCCSFSSGAWTSTDNSTYFEVRGSTTGDAQLFAVRFFPFNNGATPRILGHVLKVGSTSMAAVNDNLDPHVRSAETVTLRFVRDGSDNMTPYFGFGTAPMSMGQWKAASDHTTKVFASDSGTLARIEFKIVTPSGPGASVAFDAFIDYIQSV